MAGIIAPVMIHLWNNKQGKVLAIGSIALLEKTSRKKARSRRISERLLLLLRCLLLILLALMLAGPYWKKEPGKEQKGWVLVGMPAGGSARTMVDSLIKEGYERHDLEDSSWWKAFASLDRRAAIHDLPRQCLRPVSLLPDRRGLVQQLRLRDDRP